LIFSYSQVMAAGPRGTSAALACNATQPNVSRRYRSVARDLGLQRQSDAPVGRRFGHTPWITLLRRGVNHHRLANGVLRVGGPPALAAQLAGVPWAQWVLLGKAQRLHGPHLLQLELLDALALDHDGPWDQEGLDLDHVALVELPPSTGSGLQLACRRDPLVLEVVKRVCASP
jgi:hypothetical protein